jgi:hypothetical protein
MHNLKHAYPYNMNTPPNPIDTRSYPLLSSSSSMRSGGGKKPNNKYKNYTGRQIGCRTRAMRRTRRRHRTRARTRQQSGGDIVNNLPMDASMLVQSATKVGGDLWNGLRGTPSANPSPFPFLDQGIKNPTPISETQPQAQSGGRTRPHRKHRQRSKKAAAASSRRASSQRRVRRVRRFRQSGGDLFSYLPFDMSTTARSAVNTIGNAISGTKGLPGSVSPLPYNDHALQKPELKASDHLPNLPQYYRNANLSIPSL